MKETLYRSRLVQAVVSLLIQGVTVEKIALSLAFGISLGTFPVLGSTSFLCAAAAVIFKLNMPAIQLVNWFVYPLQLILIVPFMRAGEWLFRSGPSQLSPAQFFSLVHESVPRAISSLWLVTLEGVSVWLLCGPLCIVILYRLLVPGVRAIAATIEMRRVAAGGN